MVSTVGVAAWTFLFAVLCSNSGIQVRAEDNHKLIVLLIDGFRWNYFDNPKLNLKGFPKVMKYGVKAPYLNPVYPSLSYPNIQTFATGVYPENHGFSGNMLWDNETNTFFEMLPSPNSSDPLWWQDAEPVWITAERQGRRSALYWWSGCEVKIRGLHPQVCEKHTYMPPCDESKRDLMQRVDDVVEMFRPSVVLPHQRLDLAMMYYSGIDWAGHYAGEDSPQFKRAMYDIDEVIDYILKALRKANLQNKVNLMIASDHGMADVRNSTLISLEKYAPLIAAQVNAGPFSSLVPKQGKEDELYNALKGDNITGLKVYRRKDVPETYHIKNAKRFGPIILECEQAYFVKALGDPEKRVGDITFYDFIGEHGYAPQGHPDMRAIFLATGPDFRSGFMSKPLEMYDLYNVMCHILRIEPQPNNGTFSRVEPLLRTLADGPYFSRAADIFTRFSTVLFIITTFFCVLNFSVL